MKEWCQAKRGSVKSRRFNGICIQAFTLIELLTTISLIVVLIGLSLLAIAKAKSRSKGVACLSNQRQIGVGLQSYLADHSSFPTAAGDCRNRLSPRYLSALEVDKKYNTSIYSLRSVFHARFSAVRNHRLLQHPHVVSRRHHFGLAPEQDQRFNFYHRMPDSPPPGFPSNTVPVSLRLVRFSRPG